MVIGFRSSRWNAIDRCQTLISYLPVHHCTTVWQSRDGVHWLIWSAAALCHIVGLVQRHVAYLLTKHSWCDFFQMLPAIWCSSSIPTKSRLHPSTPLPPLLVTQDRRLCSGKRSIVCPLASQSVRHVLHIFFLSFSKLDLKRASTRPFPQSCRLIND